MRVLVGLLALAAAGGLLAALRARRGAAPAAALLVVLTAATVVLSLRRPPVEVARIDSRHWEAVGLVIGRAAREAVGRSGTVVVVEGQYDGPFRRQAAARLNGAEKALAGSGLRVEVVRFSAPRGDPFSPASLAFQEGRWGPQLAELVGRHPGAVAAVSLVGLPPQTSAEEMAVFPPLFVVDRHFAHVRRWIEQGQVKAAVAFRDAPGWDEPPPRGASMDEIFAKGCVLVTAENLYEMPEADILPPGAP